MNPDITGPNEITMVGRLQAEVARLRGEIRDRDDTLAAERDQKSILTRELDAALMMLAEAERIDQPQAPSLLCEAMRSGRWGATVRLDVGGRRLIALVSGVAAPDEVAEDEAAVEVFRFLAGKIPAAEPTAVCEHERQAMPPRLLGTCDVADDGRIIVRSDLGRRDARDARTLLRKSCRIHRRRGRVLHVLLPVPLALTVLRVAQKGLKDLAAVGTTAAGVTATITVAAGAMFSPISPFHPLGHDEGTNREPTAITQTTPLSPQPLRTKPSPSPKPSTQREDDTATPSPAVGPLAPPAGLEVPPAPMRPVIPSPAPSGGAPAPTGGSAEPPATMQPSPIPAEPTPGPTPEPQAVPAEPAGSAAPSEDPPAAEPSPDPSQHPAEPAGEPDPAPDEPVEDPGPPAQEPSDDPPADDDLAAVVPEGTCPPMPGLSAGECSGQPTSID